MAHFDWMTIRTLKCFNLSHSSDKLIMAEIKCTR